MTNNRSVWGVQVFSLDMYGMRILLPYDTLLYNQSVRMQMTMNISWHIWVQWSYNLDVRTAVTVTFNLS